MNALMSSSVFIIINMYINMKCKGKTDSECSTYFTQNKGMCFIII